MQMLWQIPEGVIRGCGGIANHLQQNLTGYEDTVALLTTYGTTLLVLDHRAQLQLG